MSYIEPNIGQSQQNKKILQELEEKKRRMRSAQTPENPGGYPPAPAALSTPEMIQSPQQQPTILKTQFSTGPTNTFGFFIMTDSVYGNQTLPVLPRF